MSVNTALPPGVESGAYWAGVAATGAPSNVPPDQYAYGVWVSEVMSQQTQIDRVAQYWLRRGRGGASPGGVI